MERLAFKAFPRLTLVLSGSALCAAIGFSGGSTARGAELPGRSPNCAPACSYGMSTCVLGQHLLLRLPSCSLCTLAGLLEGWVSWVPLSSGADPRGTLCSTSDGIWCILMAPRHGGESPAGRWLHLMQSYRVCVLTAGVAAINLSDFMDVMA